MSGAQSKRLSSIEALRGLAAIGVVLTHSARHVDKVYGDPGLITMFQAGHAGVDLFFVISGFIILFIHHGDIGQPSRLPNYARRRFTRVMPVYWVALGLTLTMALAGSSTLPSISFLLWSASLLPMAQEPFLGVAWTLQHEAVFYAVFAVLIVSREAGVALLAAWLSTIVAGLAGFRTGALPGGLSGAYGIEFFFGMGAACLVRRRIVPAPKMVAAVGAALFSTALLLESAGMLDGFGTMARLAYGLAATALVAGLAAWDQILPIEVPAWLRELGGASYSIYLFQFVFIGIAWQSWLRSGLGQHLPHAVLFASLALSAILGGLLAASVVERPLLNWFRRRTSPERGIVRPA